MDEQVLLDRIIKDAKAEAKKILKDARDTAASNIAYAREQAEKQTAEAVENAKKTEIRNGQSVESAREVERRLEELKQKTKIVDDIFADVKKELGKGDNKKLVDALSKKYAKSGDTISKQADGIIVSNSDYEIRLTIDELLADLRNDIEAEVTRMLFA